jgi:hypothetical protein
VSKLVAAATVAASLALALAGAGAARSQAEVPPEEVLERMSSAEALARDGLTDPSPATMEEIRGTLSLPVTIEADSWSGTIDDPALRSLRGDDESDFRRALARLRALRDGLEGALDTPPADADRVDAALDQAYRGSIQVDPGFIERIRRAIVELMNGLLTRLFSFRGAGSVIAWAVILAVVVLAVWLLRRLRFVPETTMRPERSPARPVRIDWNARAEEAIRRGDLRAAVHALYRGLLSTLSGRGLVRDLPALTAGECRTTVRSLRPELFDAVAEATGTFERVAFGGAEPGAQDVEAMRRAVTRARSA